VVRLKRGHEQRVRTHPWIFKGDVAEAADVTPGDVVTVRDAGGRFVGRGLFNPRPALCCRILTWTDEPIDAAFIARRIDAAFTARRARPSDLGRLIWGEADGLPGLIVDRYGPVVVVQCATLGMARLRGDVVAALRSRLGDLPIMGMDDAPIAGLEGFAPAAGWVDRPGPAEVVVEER